MRPLMKSKVIKDELPSMVPDLISQSQEFILSKYREFENIGTITQYENSRYLEIYRRKYPQNVDSNMGGKSINNLASTLGKNSNKVDHPVSPSVTTFLKK